MVDDDTSQVKAILKDLYLLVSKPELFFIMEEQNSLNFFMGELDLTLIMLDELVKDVDDWLDERVEDALKKTNKWYKEVGNRDLVVSCAVGLGNDLAKDHHS